jgi:hypothetical protein
MHRRLSCAAFFVLFGIAGDLAARGGGSEQPAITQRPASVSATISNSPKLYNGAYAGSLKSRMCGETDPMYTGNHTYLFEYPDIDDPRTIKGITDVRFFSAELVGAGRVTTKFHVSITVSPSGVGGSPPAYVVDTINPRGKESGKATLSISGGTATLDIKATDALGQELQMKIECGPK